MEEPFLFDELKPDAEHDVEEQHESHASAAESQSDTDDVEMLDDWVIDVSLNETCDGQLAFIDEDEWWKVLWRGMPEYNQDDLTPWKTLYVHFCSHDDMLAFAALVEQPLTIDTRSIWFPNGNNRQRLRKCFIDEARDAQ